MTLNEIAHSLIATWSTFPEAERATKHKTEVSAMLFALRPYVEAALTPANVRTESGDKRTRSYGLKVEIWTGTQPGKFDTCVGSCDEPEVFNGMIEAARYIGWCKNQVGAPNEWLSQEECWRALSYLRPAITKGGGKATMRRTSPDQRWHLICEVTREQ